MTASKPKCPLCHEAAERRFQVAHAAVWRCLSPGCRLSFAFPQLNEGALEAAYRQLYYPATDAASAAYANTEEEILRQIFRGASDRFGSLAGKTLLDFGCGLGGLCQIAGELAIRCTGIEADPRAREKAMRATGAKIYSDLDELRREEPQARFDLIVMWEVIEHLREPWKELRDLAALLNKEGWLLLSTPNSDSLRARLERDRWWNLVNPTHFYYFSRSSLGYVLGRAGLAEYSEWLFPVQYPAHSALRRMAHKLLFKFGLQGGLLFLASPRHANTTGKAVA